MRVHIKYEQCQGIWIARVLGDKGTLAVMTFADQPGEEEVLALYRMASWLPRPLAIPTERVYA